MRVYFGARTRVQARTRVSAPKRVSTFRQLGPRLARLAGVLRDVGVQREHRRVEHRRSVNHAGGMRRARLAARHRGERARSVFDASQPYVRIYVLYIHIRVRVGRHAPWHAFECACIQPRFPMRACVPTYQRRCTHTRARACTSRHTRTLLPLDPSARILVGGVRGRLYAGAYSWRYRCMRGGLCT